jgi:transposase
MRYGSDISDADWAQIKESFAPYGTGRRRKYEIREVVNAIRYVLRTGCQWRLLPKDFPYYKAVLYHYYKWRDSGFWEGLQGELHKKFRVQEGREELPSLAIIDSQSVKTVQKGGRVVSMQARRRRVASE